MLMPDGGLAMRSKVAFTQSAALPRPHQVMMIGGVEPALDRAFAGEGGADQHQCSACDARFLHLGADVGEGAADQQLVRPADPIGDDRGTIGTIRRGQRADDAREVGDREMDRQRRPACGEPLDRLAFRHR